MFVRTGIAALAALICGAHAQEALTDSDTPEIAEALVGEIADGELASDLETTPVYFNDSVSDPIPVVCPFKGDIDYEPGEISCGFIEVPENRSDPDSRTIRLLFAKLHAKAGLEQDESDKKDDEDEDDPIAYLTGGPGASIPHYVGRFKDHDVLKVRDIYILQQRGIEESGAFCPFYGTVRPEPVAAKNQLELDLQSAERLRNCLEAAKARGVDITAYNTVENAHDVRALRHALGFETWNVWGISYGSHLGQMLTQVDPDGIRALVIDGIVPNSLEETMRFAKWLALDFEKLFKRCGETGGPHCDGLEERFYAVLDQPWVRVEAVDDETTPAGEFYIPPYLGGFLAFSMMYQQDKYPAIPAVMDHLIEKFEDGDPSLFSGFGGILSGSGDQGMSSAIRCNDGYIQAAADELPRDLEEYPAIASAVFSLKGARALAQACIDAGVGPRDRKDYQLVETEIPTLIINGMWDPITLPALAELIAPGFSNGRLILVPYAGHGPTHSMNECSGRVLTAFYDDPGQNLDGLDATCFEEGPGAPDFISYKTTDLPLKAVSLLARDERKPIVIAGASAGLSALTLGLGLILIPVGFLARLGSFGRASVLATGDGLTRFLAFLTTLSASGAFGLLGAGAYSASQIAEESLIAGFAAPATYAPWLMLVAALLGALLVVKTIAMRLSQPVRMGTFLGFILIGISAVAIFVTAWCWDFGPF